jgi:hypothetical protein
MCFGNGDESVLEFVWAVPFAGIAVRRGLPPLHSSEQIHLGPGHIALNQAQHLFHLAPMTAFGLGTATWPLREATDSRIPDQLLLGHIVQRANHYDLAIEKRDSRFHGLNAAVVEEVQQRSLGDIVCMVAQGQLVAAETVGCQEQGFAPMPGAAETG